MNIYFRNIIFVFCLLIPALDGLGVENTVVLQKKHKVKVVVPGKSELAMQEYDLYETGGTDGIPGEYYMDVASVNCYESVCKVVPVRIFWNNLGEYLRFELKSGIRLEKAGGKPFSEEDYKKLHHILQDRNSVFKNVSIDDLVNPVSIEGVDAVTGATMLVIDINKTIKGAALSCYTLWHYANGGIISEIQQITGEACTNEQLRKFLENGDYNYKDFALQQINKKRVYDKKTVDEVIKQAHVYNELFKASVRYFEIAPDDIYFDAVKLLFKNGNGNHRISLLYSLYRTNKILPDHYFDDISLFIPNLSFQEIDLFLDVLEQKNTSSEIILDQIINLLDQNIFIARRAYWYLNGQKLSVEQQNKIVAFQERNKDYL